MNIRYCVQKLTFTRKHLLYFSYKKTGMLLQRLGGRDKSFHFAAPYLCIMKKRMLPVVIAIAVMACNNNDHNTHGSNTTAQTPVDSLKKEIDDIHIVGMSKMARLNQWQQRTQQFIDSLSNLPGQVKDAARALRSQADTLLSELNYADYAMNTWMPEFYSHTDTLSDKPEQLLEYLKNEKDKASKITDAILEGIKKAEQLLQEK